MNYRVSNFVQKHSDQPLEVIHEKTLPPKNNVFIFGDLCTYSIRLTANLRA